MLTSKSLEQLGLVVDALIAANIPALSAYELGKIIYLKDILSQAESPKQEFKSLIDSILKLRLLAPLNKTNAYLVFGRNATPAEIVCSLDPFTYVSHLSAMEYHGLTDRFPKILYITRPTTAEWRIQAERRMQKDLNGRFTQYKESGLPTLVRPKFTTIERTSIQFHERSQLGAFRSVSDSPLRVATIGRVFLDMLREPKSCGGIQHVLDIYMQDAKKFLKFIVDEVETHGKPIDKVRIGYVLNEVCKLQHAKFADWKKFAQRGGSRKLNPAEEFSGYHSESWKLSINVPSLTPDNSDTNNE